MVVENSNIIGVFEDEDVLISAMKKIKENKVKIKNVFTPYPIHEVIHEMGLKTRLPYVAFVYGVMAVIVTFGFLYWTSVISYPTVFGGKPENSLSFIIIMFVMTINLTVVLSTITFFLIQKLGPGKNPTIIHPDITDDKYVIVIEKSANMSKEEIVKIKAMLVEVGATQTDEKDNIENI